MYFHLANSNANLIMTSPFPLCKTLLQEVPTYSSRILRSCVVGENENLNKQSN